MRKSGTKKSQAICLFGTSLLALTMAMPVSAQVVDREGAVSDPDAIIVTASRRDTDVQDTPLSIAVTTGEALERNSVVSFQDLTRIEPSIVVNNQGVAGNQFIIRGILSDIGSTTGLYLDEMPLLGGGSVEGAGDGRPGLRLHDVDRIEVLKGPQGTLFGSGSMAGTLRIITNKPELQLVEGGATGSVSFIDGGNELWEGDAFFNLPIGDQIALRTVAWMETGGGFIDHRITTLDGSTSSLLEDANDRDVWGARVSLLFEPSPDFSVLVMGVHQEVDVDDTESWSLDAGPYVSTSPTIEGYHDNYDAASATFEYSAQIGTFSIIGTYANHEVANPEDSTPTGLGLAESFNVVPFKTLYQTSQTFEAYTGEARYASDLAGPLQFVVGAYYQHDEANGLAVAVRADDASGIAPCLSVEECEALGRREPGPTRPLLFPPDYFFPQNAFNPASDVVYAVSTDRTVEQWALYGQADLELTPSLTATAGLRYFDASIHDIGMAIQDIAGPPDFAVFPGDPVPSWAANGMITTPYVTQDDRASENSPSYNFSLLYEVTPDLSLFARVASGFRIGGTNNAAQLAGQSGVTIPASYGSDDLWSYELGIKTYLVDRDLFIDASIYQMDWSEQQLAAQDPSGAFDYVLNAGQSRIRGAELSVGYSNDVGISLGAGLTFTDAKLVDDLAPEVIAAGTVGFAGDRLPRIPRWTAAAQARYDGELNDTLDFYVQTDLSYRGSSNYSFNDQNTFNQELPASTLLGMQAGVRTENVDVSLFVRNLTNEAAVFGLDASPDGLRVYSPNPRAVGLKVSAQF